MRDNLSTQGVRATIHNIHGTQCRGAQQEVVPRAIKVDAFSGQSGQQCVYRLQQRTLCNTCWGRRNEISVQSTVRAHAHLETQRVGHLLMKTHPAIDMCAIIYLCGTIIVIVRSSQVVELHKKPRGDLDAPTTLTY